MAKLGDIATYINGYAFKPQDWSDEGILIIRIQDLTGNSYQANRYNGEYASKYEVNDGDVLISWSASLGVYVWHGEKAVLNQHIFKVVFDKERISKDFFVHQVGLILENAASDAHGATMKHLTKPVFDALPFYLPPYEKQCEIAGILDKVTSLISLRKQQLAKLGELVKARFVEMFENNTYPKVKVSTVCDFITKGTTPPNDLISEEYSSDKVPYLKVYNLSFNGELLFDTAPQYISENIHNGMLARSKVYPNDVLMNIVGPPLGKFSLVTDEFPEWNINQAIAIFRAKEKINPKYLLSALMQPEVLNPFLRQAVGIRQLNLSLSQCRDLEIFLPPLSLQNQFSAFVAEVDKSKLFVGSAAAHKPFDIGFFSQKHCATPCKRGIISSKHMIFH